MNQQQWNDGLNNLDIGIIEEYVTQRDAQEKKSKSRAIILRVSAIAACLAILIGSILMGIFKFQRISYPNNHGDHLGEDDDELPCKDAEVIFEANETFPESFPIYKISKHLITTTDLHQMEENLGITNWYWHEYDGFSIRGWVHPFADPNRKNFSSMNYSDEEIEQLSWDTLCKIPFLNPDEYEYVGITETMDIWSMKDGTLINVATISFRRVLDGFHITGNDVCKLSFDGTGLQGLAISMFDYQKVGTMNLIPLQDAKERITNPDYFSPYGIKISKLCVKKTWFLLENQYSKGCTVLQPVYRFVGKATLVTGKECDFYSIVIAVPESYTYKKPWWRK